MNNVDVPATPQPAVALIASFEGLRGVCALLVVFFHFGLVNANLIEGAYLFVDVFFVLSGYIMMLNYGNRVSDGRSVVDFLIKRLARIYPLFIFTTITFVIASIYVRPYVEQLILQAGLGSEPLPHLDVMDHLSAAKLISWVTLTSSLHLFDRLFLNFPAWSIGTEFWTYVVFAGVLILFRKRLAAVAVVLVTVSLAITAYYSTIGHGCLMFGQCINVTFDVGLFRCVGGFFLGVLAFKWNALLAHSNYLALARQSDVSLLALLFLVVWLSIARPASAFAMPFVAAMLVTVLPLGGPASRLLSRKPFLWLGKMSFAIYLGHMTILIGLGAVFQSPVIPLYVKLAVLLLSVALLAVLANRLVEEPARRYIVGLLRRFMGKLRAKPAAVSIERT